MSLMTRNSLLSVAIALGLGWLLGAPERPPDAVQARARDDWQLPELPRWERPNALLLLASGAPMWGQLAKVTAEEVGPAPDPRWRLAGIVRVRGQPKALVAFMDPSKPQLLLSLGEVLPTGHKITRIDEREVCVAIGKRSYTLPIERIDLAP